MKTTTITAAIGTAVLILTARPCAASGQHQLLHRHQHQHQHPHPHHQHQHHPLRRDIFGPGFGPTNASANPRYESRRPEKIHARDGAKCQFPEDKGLFAVTPGSLNGGWALAPDQECVDGTWCPIACPPGKLMAQWKPNTHYTFPASTCGGIYCNNGQIEVPFKDKPWCVDGTGAVEAVNKAGAVVSFCQTVLPGYEDMIIPTDVYDTATLAVPDPSYWDSTASHFYINAPGVSSDEGCHWGDVSKPIGNWAPYVAGANTDSEGNTFVKLGINPVWQDSDLYNTKPTFGLEIECDGDCNGLPCKIDGSGVVSNEKADGAGGSPFCVVTVTSGGKASIIVSNLDGSGGDETGGETSSSSSSSSSSSAEPTSSYPVSTSTQEPTSTAISTPSTTSVPPTTSAYPTSPPSSTEEPTTVTTTSTSSRFTSAYPVSPSPTSSSFFFGGLYYQNETSSSSGSSLLRGPTSASAHDVITTTATISGSTAGSTSKGASESAPTSSESSKTGNAGPRQDGTAIAGLVVAFVAAVYLL
ncbi:beta-glucosidase-domain-containing protein [Xylariaceae sp. FL0594]|nr:beta-glucosidase-domain-containing protein [Xylariaceae sp. FL0594]